MCIKVWLAEIHGPVGKPWSRGKYRAQFDGQEIFRGAEPVFNACRVLLAMGVAPASRVEFWRAGKAHADFLVSSVAYGARREVRECPSLEFVKFRPRNG